MFGVSSRCTDDVPLLHVAGAERAVDGEHALAEARGRRRRDRRDARAVLQHERRRDRVERALRDGLQERERRRRERRRDARHLDPDQAVAGADDRLVREPVDGAQARAEVVLLQRPHRLRPRVLELLRLQVEDRRLAVDLGRRKIQRVAQAGIDGEPVRDLPVVLDEVLLEARALLNLRLLQIDRERLDLAEQEAGERRAGVRRRRAGRCRSR